MSTPRDIPGMPMSADDVHQALARLVADTDTGNCARCGWTAADPDDTCQCDDGQPMTSGHP
jgi:hypothetical protein